MPPRYTSGVPPANEERPPSAAIGVPPLKYNGGNVDRITRPCGSSFSTPATSTSLLLGLGFLLVLLLGLDLGGLDVRRGQSFLHGLEELGLFKRGELAVVVQVLSLVQGRLEGFCGHVALLR